MTGPEDYIKMTFVMLLFREQDPERDRVWQ